MNFAPGVDARCWPVSSAMRSRGRIRATRHEDARRRHRRGNLRCDRFFCRVDLTIFEGIMPRRVPLGIAECGPQPRILDRAVVTTFVDVDEERRAATGLSVHLETCVGGGAGSRPLESGYRNFHIGCPCIGRRDPMHHGRTAQGRVTMHLRSLLLSSELPSWQHTST